MNGIAADLAGWATSGAMLLTGPADGPPSPVPAPLSSVMSAIAHDLAVQTGRWGRAVVVDGPALLGERAALTAMTRNGDVSVGGSARFVASADGWVVLNLPRSEDVASLPALVERTVPPDDWVSIAAGLRRMTGDLIVERAGWLGMAVSVPGRGPTPAAPNRALSRGTTRRTRTNPLIVDLSSLWAGPLAASLLGEAGARVIKIEGRGRPDGARLGASSFFDLLNREKECVRIDFDDRDDRRFLRRLLAAADLVIEASRPRAMDAVGISPEALAHGGTSWLSLTAHGRTGPAAQRVGFGDDAAAAGGLFVEPETREGAPPWFVADAVADPLAGLIAAVVGAELLADDRASVMEVPLARAAAWAAAEPVQAVVVADGDGWAVDVGSDRIRVAVPRHRAIPAPAHDAGSHDVALRDEFGPSSSRSGPG